jgi:hypothetical protein
MSGILNEYITYNSATRTLNIFEIDEDWEVSNENQNILYKRKNWNWKWYG